LLNSGHRVGALLHATQTYRDAVMIALDRPFAKFRPFSLFRRFGRLTPAVTFGAYTRHGARFPHFLSPRCPEERAITANCGNCGASVVSIWCSVAVRGDKYLHFWGICAGCGRQIQWHQTTIGKAAA